MIESIKISGFKNFRGKSIKLDNLNRLNILVGINGSGKSSVLELLLGVSMLSQLNKLGEQDILVRDLAQRLHSLFEPETQISFTYTTSPDRYALKITPQAGDRWKVDKSGRPSGGTKVVAILRPGATPFGNEADSPLREENPFGGIKIFDRDQHIVLPDLEDANKVLAKVNPSQRMLRKMNLSSGQFTFEDNNEIRPEFLAGGSRYIAGLIAASRSMDKSRPLMIIDDLGDELFPAVRKQLLPELNELLESLNEPKFMQMFATTHNIEIVKSALDHPEYCSVYMFNYDGSLIEFNGARQKTTNNSKGIHSSDAVPAIAKMLGIEDLDLGFPELIILTEEETKKTFIDGLSANDSLKDQLRKVDVHVPFQTGDGNTSKAIHNMLDLSKYLFFSETWSERYAVFFDYNSDDYESNGLVKDGGSRLKALAAAQFKLGLNERYILTKSGSNYVLTFEDTYPISLWSLYKKENNIDADTIQTYLETASSSHEKGKLKNGLAKFMSSHVTKRQLIEDYPELSNLLLKEKPLPTSVPPIVLSHTPSSEDDIYGEALRLVVELDKASTSLLQTKLGIGYARAARIIDQLEENGVIGPSNGSRPRVVLANKKN